MGVSMAENLSKDVLVAPSEDDCEQPPTAARRFGWRHVMSLLIFSIVTVCYADRTNIGIVLAEKTFPGIPKGDKGSILSAFFVGYMCTQVVGGMLARRIGGVATLLIAAAVWTCFDILTPLAAQGGFNLLYMDRVGMGLGEGMMFPTQQTLANFWVPSSEKAFLVTFMTSGQDIGSVLANVISPQLLKVGTWCVFAFWGSVALVWCIFYVLLAASAPEIHKSCVKTGEADWIRSQRGAPHIEVVQNKSESPLPMRLLREPCVWAIIVAHFGNNYSWYVVLSWMPTFFSEHYGLELSEHPLILTLPYLVGWFGILFAGKASDRLVARGFRTRHVRKAVQFLGAAGCAVLMQVAASMEDATWAAVALGAALFFGKWQSAGYWVNMVDICPESAGTLVGISNTIATIPGIVGNVITQKILNASGSWHVVYGVGGAVGIVAALVFAAFGDDVSIDVKHDESHSEREGGGEP